MRDVYLVMVFLSTERNHVSRYAKSLHSQRPIVALTGNFDYVAVRYSCWLILPALLPDLLPDVVGGFGGYGRFF